MCLFPKSTRNCCSPDCSWAISLSGPPHWGSPSAARRISTAVSRSCLGIERVGLPPPSGGGPAVRVLPPTCDSGYGKVRSACSVEGFSNDAGPSVGDQGTCRDRQVLA